eukprot:TRINITY_DN7072_c0_g1_i1.p2 TRINITY_DN7072_c0_g1~~TRINITY_DN7072_c0_g1_i1.p2  ORF type:complete len:430 (-),score=64.88 TRINITY_DN7072_c0_g1_i1:530-1741(-)
MVATASLDRTVKLWQLPSLILLRTLKGHKRGVWGAHFSPVEKVLATSSGDMTIKLWNVGDGSCIRTFEGSQGGILKGLFVGAGLRILSSGADGLVRVWGVKSGECLNTFDEHDDKVWALAVGGNEDSIVVTGDGAGRLNLWYDATEELQEEHRQKQQEIVEKSQNLENALLDQEFLKAAQIAFELDQPGRFLRVIQQIQSNYQLQQERDEMFNTLVRRFADEQIAQCLRYVREWNVSGKLCHEAQEMLGAIFRTKNPKELTKIPGIGDLFEAIESYTKRHFQRLDRLCRSLHLITFTLGEMDVLAPKEYIDIDNDHRVIQIKKYVQEMEQQIEKAQGQVGGDDLEDDFDIILDDVVQKKETVVLESDEYIEQDDNVKQQNGEYSNQSKRLKKRKRKLVVSDEN